MRTTNHGSVQKKFGEMNLLDALGKSDERYAIRQMRIKRWKKIGFVLLVAATLILAAIAVVVLLDISLRTS